MSCTQKLKWLIGSFALVTNVALAQDDIWRQLGNAPSSVPVDSVNTPWFTLLFINPREIALARRAHRTSVKNVTITFIAHEALDSVKLYLMNTGTALPAVECFEQGATSPPSHSPGVHTCSASMLNLLDQATMDANVRLAVTIRAAAEPKPRSFALINIPVRSAEVEVRRR